MAGIVRQEQRGGTRVFSFADLEAEGRAAIEQARAQAREILQAAEHRASQLAAQATKAAHANAYQRGLEEGRTAGLKQMRAEAHEAAVRDARAQVAALVGSLAALLNEFEQSKRRLIAAAESGLIELALAIARRVCKLEAGAATEAARANARHLLELVRHHADAVLRVNPAEYEGLRELGPELLAQGEQLGHVKIVADEAVSPGGCVLATQAGQVDATIETQLDRIAAALRVDAAREQPAATLPPGAAPSGG